MDWSIRLFVWAATLAGRGIAFRSTNEHVPSLLGLAREVPHERILGIIGGADQLLSFLCLDPPPEEIVGIDSSSPQLELARIKTQLVARLDFGEYLAFCKHQIPLERRRKILQECVEGMSLPELFARTILKRKLIISWPRLRCEIPWHENQESYDRVRRNLPRMSLIHADLTRPSGFRDRGAFDLLYLSNVLRWTYSAKSLALHPKGDSRAANSLLAQLDPHLKPGGHFLFLLDAEGRRSQPRERFLEHLSLTLPARHRVRHMFGPAHYVYSLAPRSARIHRYHPLLPVHPKGKPQGGHQSP
jgi:SAM-dependent methyltransferase